MTRPPRARARRPDCDDLGLLSHQYAVLTGFSGRAIRALAHLREAWCVADPQNAAQVAAAIRVLLLSHSLAEIRSLCARVLTHGLDDGRAAEMLTAVGLPTWDVVR
jgi:hypothetical protein